MRSWKHNFQNTKVELYSEVSLCKMIQDRMQFFLSKDHQHPKSRLQEQWTLYQDYQDAQDKQVTQHQLTGQKGRCTDVIENSDVRMSQIFGYVYQNTNGKNHGPVWKIRSFLQSEICTVILWQDCYGKGNSRKFYLKHGWEKVPNWECLFVNQEQGPFLCVFRTI